jgi:hypothetical protein
MTRSSAALGVAVVISLTLGAGPASADTFVSDFQAGFDGWQQQWHKESTTGTDGVVTHSSERGYLDRASLKFDMGDGFGDDGTLWIEKQFAVPAGVPTPVSLSFQLFNEFQSDFNTFQVKAAISTNNPNEQADFTTIGSTDSAEGWVPFTYEDTITSPTGRVWVAAAIRVAWETPRVYWIDHAVVSTAAIPEPPTAALLFAGLAATAVVFSRRSRRAPTRTISKASPPATLGRASAAASSATPTRKWSTNGSEPSMRPPSRSRRCWALQQSNDGVQYPSKWRVMQLANCSHNKRVVCGK